MPLFRKKSVEIVPEDPPHREAAAVGPVAITASGLITRDQTTMSVRYESLEDIKLAIAELRHLKKEKAAEKREVNDVVKAKKAEYRLMVGTRGSVMRGGGKVGSFVRMAERSSRDSARAHHAREMDQFESVKASIDYEIVKFDEMIRGLERAQMEAKGNAHRETKQVAPVMNEAPRSKFCTSCGSTLPSGVRFCGQCGTQIS